MKTMLYEQIHKGAMTLVLAGLVLGSGPAFSTIITYTDRSTFEAAIINDQTDTFESASYAFINSAATMKALSVASIGYESTFFTAPNLNIVSSGRLCWGCNGSGQVLLDDTTIGSSSGVFGFGIDILSNHSSLPYDAFVTFGDNSTQNFDLGSGAAFFGITADQLIRKVQLGPANGGTTDSGSFQIDNVTIGNAVPEPATVLLVSLGLAGMGIAGRRRPNS